MTSTVLILLICFTVPVVMIGLLIARPEIPEQQRERDASRRRHPSTVGPVPHVRVLADKPYDYEQDAET